jgi:hypothetical protein
MIDYKTSGCDKYGAQMGRRSDLRLDTVSKCKLHRVRLDSGGYDQGGAYWGITGNALYYVEATDGDDEGKILYVRGASRDDAKDQFPNATFFRCPGDKPKFAVPEGHPHPTDHRVLRHVEFDGYRLMLWDTFDRDDGGRHALGYVMWDRDGNVLFDGKDYSVGCFTCIDSDEAVRGLIGFLTLRPGDTDDEYFEKYTRRQMEWAKAEAGYVSMWAEDDSRLEPGDKPLRFRKVRAR